MSEIHEHAADAVGLVRATVADDGAGVGALLSGMSQDERDGVLVALVHLAPLWWSAAYRAGVRFGSENVPADELDELEESDELVMLERAELGAYLGGVVEHARRVR